MHACVRARARTVLVCVSGWMGWMCVCASVLVRGEVQCQFIFSCACAGKVTISTEE